MQKFYENTGAFMRKKIIKIYAVILSIGLAYFLIIRLTGFSLPCFYLKTTGYQCPGCGATRMFMALFRLDFAAAFSYHPVLMILFFLWNAIALLCLTEKVKFVQKEGFLMAMLAISVVALLIFCYFRNMA